ncbi:MAG: Na/Pi cotransporter family protein [Clostridiales bacterium]|nr:Na/Pi cotransporter family protein [Clostridiales bacterium]MDY4200049.1 Na/Pi cotransporter family protein [Candidatus Fimadaptatus sp.]
MTLSMTMALLGGLALFLYGMKLMGEGLEKAAGDRLKRLLEALTRNPLMGLLVGVVFTMIIQSSSATTVMVVGFVNAGLLDLMQATGVILGANIGTTVTAWIVAGFQATAFMPLILLIGVAMMMFLKKLKLQRIGQVVAGFGMLFVGMGMMSDAMKPLAESAEFARLMTAFSNPIMALLVGVAVTAIIQSSSASVGILEMLAIQGLVPLETSLYIIMGTNIGTCVTAMLSAVGATRTAKRAALIHLMFNVLGTLVVFILVSLLPVSTWIGHINGPALQIAVAHTSFKVFEVLCFVLLRKWLVKLVMILVPGEDKQGEGKSLKFLDDRILSTPPIAVAQICKEIERMGDIAIANLTRAMDAFFNKDSSLINEVEQNEDVVNYLNHEITRYMVAAAQLDLPASDVEQLGEMFHVVNDLERIGDHAENMAEYANSRIEEEIPFSEDGLAELRDMLDKTVALFKLSMEAFHTRDQHLLPRVLVQEENIDDMEKTLQQSHVDRLTRGACTPRSGMIFSDMLSNLERVADHATNVAFSIQADQTVT